MKLGLAITKSKAMNFYQEAIYMIVFAKLSKKNCVNDVEAF